MTLSPKDHAEAIAIFRSEIIGGLTRREFDRGELQRELVAIAKQRWRAPDADHTRTYGVRTLERWYAAYRKGGLEALRPEPRSDRGRALALTAEQRDLLLDIRREFPFATVPTILRTLTADGRIAAGTTAFVLTPHDLIERLVALVPRPRAHLTRYHGVFAPAFAARAGIVPKPGAGAASARTGNVGSPSDNQGVPAKAPAANPRRYLPWASLIWRVFLTDVLACARCGGRMQVVAAVTAPPSIERILAHLGLSSTLAEFHPARPPPQGEFGWPAEHPTFDPDPPPGPDFESQPKRLEIALPPSRNRRAAARALPTSLKSPPGRARQGWPRCVDVVEFDQTTRLGRPGFRACSAVSRLELPTLTLARSRTCSGAAHGLQSRSIVWSPATFQRRPSSCFATASTFEMQ